MKRIVIVFSMLVFWGSLCEGQSWVWGREPGIVPTGGGDILADHSVAADSHGNAYITAYFEGSLHFGSYILTTNNIDAYLVKYDTSGNVIWAEQSVSTGTSGAQGNSVTIGKSGNSYLTGYFVDTVSFGSFTLRASGTLGIFTVKYDALGNVIWAKQGEINTINGYAIGSSIAVDSQENVYVTGYFSDTLSFGSVNLITKSTYDMFLIKYDVNGNLIWGKQGLLPSSASSGMALSIATDAWGKIFVAGGFTDTITLGSFTLKTPSTAGFLAKYDSAGNIIWVKQSILASSSSSGGGNSVSVDRAGNAYITGGIIDTVSFDSFKLINNWILSVPFVVKYDANGKVIWAKQGTHSDSNEWYGNSISCDTSIQGGCDVLIIGGGTTSVKLKFGLDTFKLVSNHTTATTLIHFDSSGNVQCGSVFSEGDEDDGDGIAVDPSGKYVYITGDLFDTTIFAKDTLPVSGTDFPFIARWSGCNTIETTINPIQNKTEPISLFPNPNSGIFTIVLSHSAYIAGEKTSVEIYNVMGEQVLKQIRQSADDNLIELNQPNGIYFYRVIGESGNVIGSGKVEIQK